MRSDRIASLFDQPVSAALEDPAEVSPDAVLFPEEAVAVQNAVATRRREMAAGRAAARRALSALSVAPTPIPRGDRGRPLWPHGVTGSITHCRTLAAAVVCSEVVYRSIGIDLEPDAGIEPSLFPSILRPGELEAVEKSPYPGRLARALFCAKEAVYKCQYPLSHTFLEFHDVEIHLEMNEDAKPAARRDFAAVFLRPAGPFGVGDRLFGRLDAADGYLIAGAFALEVD